MCLIVLAWQQHPDFPLIVAANRDEFYARPTAPAARWPDMPKIIGGRDLEAGGTWLGIHQTGRFAAVTNVREGKPEKGLRSRGELTRNFLAGHDDALDYLSGLDMAAYGGFNLLVQAGDTLAYASNRGQPPHVLGPGIYGLSNHRLDTSWPKLERAKANSRQALQSLPDTSAWFNLLADRTPVEDTDLPDTGVPLAWERLLATVFIASADYGTRASTVLLQDRNGAYTLMEKSFGPNGQWLQDACISTGV